MFLKDLRISSFGKTIREIKFRKGLNLIVDETKTTESAETKTGNNVGKTTVLKLVDFCFGADEKIIYLDPDSMREENRLVRDFLRSERVLISLTLKQDLDDPNSPEILIDRNFHPPRKEIVRKINDVTISNDEEFDTTLLKSFFPNHTGGKPTFRQVVSHNIRYRDEAISSTLRTVDKYTTDVEYEALHLFMLGVMSYNSDEKQQLNLQLKQIEAFRARLESRFTKSAYEALINGLESEIAQTIETKNSFNLNPDFEHDLDKLSDIRFDINRLSAEIGNLRLRKELIEEASQELESSISNVDLQQLRMIYDQATSKIDNLQRTFEDMVSYHNTMIGEKVRFIKTQLPELESLLDVRREALKQLLDKEKLQVELVSKGDSFADLELVIERLNDLHRRKGEYDSILRQLNEVEVEQRALHKRLSMIEESLFSEEFEEQVKQKVSRFNTFFSSVSSHLYGERYYLQYEIKRGRNGHRLYKFDAFNENFSSRKKQGEISSFDIAYIKFADAEGIPALHFLLNDKKELMHDNQLVRISELVEKNNLQFVASILRDKLPQELNKDEFIVLRLSQEDKLFRIENWI